MSIERRISAESRRRRVLYQTTREFTPESAAERRASEKLREARRPTASYGSHVNRRLRGRWFSLVPIRRTTMSFCALAIFGCAVLFTLLHWSAVAWPTLANNPDLARPLRLDRPDSFGSWAKAFFLAASSATALLVYQLRRYKVDDYKGHYRIWRPMIVLFAVMSVDSVCDLVPWWGAMIDALLGRRMALSGADWIRIVMTVGGAALALRLSAEVRKSRLALAMMVLAVSGFAIPLLSRWSLLDATTEAGWLTVTSAPLIAAAALWTSVGGYLRFLLREVRGLDQAPQVQEAALDPIIKIRSRNASASKTSVKEQEQEDAKSGWAARFWPTRHAKLDGEKTPSRPSTIDKDRVKRPVTVANASVGDVSHAELSAPDSDLSSKTSSRRWFGLLRAKSDATKLREPKPKESKPKEQKPVEEKSEAKVQPKVIEKPLASEPKSIPKTDKTVDNPPKKSWFSFGRSKPSKTSHDIGAPSTPASTPKPVPVRGKTSVAENKPIESNQGGSKTVESKPAKSGLGSWLRRDSAANSSSAQAKSNVPTPAPSKQPAATAASHQPNDDDDEEGDDGSVDWSTMNKSERRRMRKELKRGGTAA